MQEDYSILNDIEEVTLREKLHLTTEDLMNLSCDHIDTLLQILSEEEKIQEEETKRAMRKNK